MWDELRLSVHVRTWPTCWTRNTCWESGHGTTDHKTTLSVSLPENFKNCTYPYRVHSQVNSLLSWPVLDTNAQTEQHMALWYITHLCSKWWGEGISTLWFRAVFQPTTWEFSILIFSLLFGTFPVPRETVELSVELLPSILWWDVQYRAEGVDERMSDVLSD